MTRIARAWGLRHLRYALHAAIAHNRARAMARIGLGNGTVGPIARAQLEWIWQGRA